MIQLRGKRVGVEKFKKAVNQVSGGLIMPKGQGEEFYGIVKYVGPEVPDLKTGIEVYFGTQHQMVRMAGTEIAVMDESNVLAISSEDKA